jgi:hypothetical protein
MQLAAYRLYRSNYIFFFKRTDGYSITVRDGLTFTFKKGEMQEWARYWLKLSKESWGKLLSALGVQDLCTGMTAEGVTFVHNAALPQDINCICPTCTERGHGLR